MYDTDRFLTIRRHEDDTSATKVTDNAHRRNLLHRLAGRELPLAYIAWLLYSLGLSARIWLIYGPWYNVVGVVTVRMFFGTNALRLAVSLTAIVFFLLVSTHHDAPVASQRQVSVVMATMMMVIARSGRRRSRRRFCIGSQAHFARKFIPFIARVVM